MGGRTVVLVLGVGELPFSKRRTFESRKGYEKL